MSINKIMDLQKKLEIKIKELEEEINKNNSFRKQVQNSDQKVIELNGQVKILKELIEDEKRSNNNKNESKNI